MAIPKSALRLDKRAWGKVNFYVHLRQRPPSVVQLQRRSHCALQCWRLDQQEIRALGVKCGSHGEVLLTFLMAAARCLTHSSCSRVSAVAAVQALSVSALNCLQVQVEMLPEWEPMRSSERPSSCCLEASVAGSGQQLSVPDDGGGSPGDPGDQSGGGCGGWYQGGRRRHHREPQLLHHHHAHGRGAAAPRGRREAGGGEHPLASGKTWEPPSTLVSSLLSD